MNINLRSILCLLCMALTLAACDAVGTVTDENTDSESDDPGESPSTATVVNHYAGPGSRWDVKLKDDDTFEVTVQDSAEGAVNVTVEGTYEELPSGFLSMTVESSEGEDGPAPGDQALGLDIPGFAFVLHPLDDETDDMHMMVSTGSCPEEPMDGNWIMMKDMDNTPATDPEAAFFGTFNFDLANQYADIPSLYALTEFNPVGETEPTQEAQCEDGVFSVPDADMYVTESGIMTGALSTNDQEGFDKYLFGVPNERTAGLEAINGEYTGLAYAGHDDPGQRVFPVSLTCEGGQCTGAEMTDLDSGALSEETVELSFEPPNTPELGILRGVISQSANADGTTSSDVTRPAHVACAASTQVLDTDHKILSCVGMSPDNPEHAFSMVLRSAIE